MCLYPKIIKNKKYTNTFKNGGNIPAITDNRVMYVPVGCGKCMECMKKKSRDWQVRLLEDVRHNKNGIFTTLTISNENYEKLSGEIKYIEGYERDNAIAKLAMRRFLERWRKEHKKSVRHWFVTELGHNGTENIHMHGIIWTDMNQREIEKHWQYGYVWLGSWVNEQTINYITKYINKIDLQHKEYTPRVLTSSGIGKGYIDRYDAELNKYKENNTKETYTNRQGYKMNLPIYWRNKLYTDEEKEKLWIEKLDKETRYINGIKIDVSKGDEQYYKVLEQERIKNTRYGYGNNEINWERRLYENERRNMLHNERINKKKS